MSSKPSVFIQAAIALLSACLTVACSDTAPASASNSNLSSGDAGTCTDLTYENFGQPFFNLYCSSCHAASVTGNARQGAPRDDVFDSVEQIRGSANGIAAETVSSKRMPDDGASAQPSDDERKLLGEWLSCGAPE
jgi:uncharacterized membrane protein